MYWIPSWAPAALAADTLTREPLPAVGTACSVAICNLKLRLYFLRNGALVPQSSITETLIDAYLIHNLVKLVFTSYSVYSPWLRFWSSFLNRVCQGRIALRSTSIRIITNLHHTSPRYVFRWSSYGTPSLDVIIFHPCCFWLSLLRYWDDMNPFGTTTFKRHSGHWPIADGIWKHPCKVQHFRCRRMYHTILSSRIMGSVL